MIKPAVTRLSEGWKSIVNGTFPKSISISPLFFQSFYKYSMPIAKPSKNFDSEHGYFVESLQSVTYAHSTRHRSIHDINKTITLYYKKLIEFQTTEPTTLVVVQIYQVRAQSFHLLMQITDVTNGLYNFHVKIK